MVKTPFGVVRILADGRPIDCPAEPYSFDKPMTRARPLGGCRRVRVPGEGHRQIRCVLEGSAVRGMDSSGEDYQAVEFLNGNTQLTIGTRTDRPELEVVPGPCGITVTVLGNIPEVVFGIAWVEDHQGSSDVRTWFAADPTLD